MHKKIHSFFKGILGYATQHKIISSVIIIVACIIGYYTYQHFKPVPPPQYVLSMVRSGSIVQTVTGSGQVTASNQTDIKSQVSGTITALKVTVGQHVHAGDLLATIDSTSALLDLQNAQLALAKLTQPAKETDISNTTNNLTASYSDGFNTVSNAFLDLPTTMNGMKDILTGSTGFMTDSRVSYLSPTAQQYRNTAEIAYYKAVNQYVTVLDEYRGLSRTSATSSIELLIGDTYDLLKNVAVALQDIQGTFTFIVTNQPEYYAKDATTAGSNIHTWSTTITGDVSAVLSARNTISSNKNSLSTLITGADTLDIQSQQLALEQKRQTYDNYFIRAPFDGIVGRIPVNVYDQASGSSVIATIVGDQKVSTISLNEVDAAKVAVGQDVRISFDAIDNLNATGTVISVDQIGTVTSGVVSYGVKVAINTVDPRIKPGMSINVTIITKQIDDVFIVPSSAVKTLNRKQYVETIPVPADVIASSSPRRPITISSSDIPTQIPVTLGESDDTNTQITDGLTSGQYVITRTIASSSQTTTAAPSILSSFGGARGTGGAGGTRGAGSATARPGN